MRITQPAQDANIRPDKNYFGPVYPEAPKFADPQDDLLDIGVTNMSAIRLGRLHLKGRHWKWEKDDDEEKTDERKKVRRAKRSGRDG
jgi:hypothetical protein